MIQLCDMAVDSDIRGLLTGGVAREQTYDMYV